jgi:GNAT superfamily N-acetyltransferase
LEFHNGHLGCAEPSSENEESKLIKVAWCDQNSNVDQLADFFAEQVTPSYISHSELQLGRARTPHEWAPNLKTIFRNEIAQRLINPNDPRKRIATAHDGNALVGLVYVTFDLDAPIPFFILEDIVISKARRGSGIGQAMIDWIFSEGRRQGAKRAFLESGKYNHDAHHFFERNGFEQISIVMMAELARP